MIKQLIYRFLIMASFLVGLSLIWACSKEDAPPKLTVLSPESNVFVATNSQLEIKVRCSDDIGLKKLIVFIKSTNLDQTFTSVSHIFNDEIEQVVTLSIDFSQIILPGGNYYLHVSLRDDEQQNSSFVPFQYGGTPQNREQVILLGSSAAGIQLIAFSDSTQQIFYQSHPEREFNLSGSTAAQQFAIQDVFQEGVQVYGTDLQIVQEIDPYRLHPQRSFNNICYSDENLWVCFDNGRISKFSPEGAELTQINLNSGLRPFYAKEHDGRLFVYAKDPINQTERLLVFLSNTGGGLGEKSLSTDGFIGVFPNGKDKYLMVYQKGDDVQIQELIYPSLGGFVIEQVFNAKVYACADEDLLWLATSDGLYSFQYQTNNLLKRNTTVYQYLWIDERAGQLWACTADRVEMRDLGGLVLEEQLIHPTADSVISAVGLYNY